MISLKRPLIILAVVVTLLLVPLTAMQFTSKVNWSLFDFLVMGTLLTTAGFSFDFVLRKFRAPNKRMLWIIAVIVLFLLIWTELAVGVFGTPLAGS